MAHAYAQSAPAAYGGRTPAQRYALLLAVASRPGAARIAAIGFGLVTVLGLIDGNDVLGRSR